MAINPKSHLGLTLFTLGFIFFSSIPSSLAVSDAANYTVYELLPKFGLPSGLLPDSVTDFTLASDGRFIVVLEKPCYVQFDYLVYYDNSITGKLGYGSITDLKGIQVQRFFLWFDVDKIMVDLPPSESIYFQVGFINKKLDIDQFKTIRSCRDSLSGSCLGSLKQVLQPKMADSQQIQLLERRLDSLSTGQDKIKNQMLEIKQQLNEILLLQQYFQRS